MQPISAAEFLARWKTLWEIVRVSGGRTNGKGGTREAFELFTAALVYQRNSLASFTADALHRSLRPVETDAPSTALHIPEPLFENFRPVDGKTGLAQLHLASASFRLGTAFELATGFRIGRRLAPNYFGALHGLKCCERGALGPDPNAAMEHALVHRDDFGHGEVGDATEYGKGRKDALNATHVCRIVQAQQASSTGG
jgi:hypothetical protein